ncbi:MAG TPA: TolC family protein, partial [Candidatus Omnitrophota bacterium]|nr:TolC family protein [Candidatus Omnitrophota bacterium]
AKIANAQYSSRLTTFNDWIIIEGNLVNAQKNYLDAQENLLVAEAYWVQAKGGTLDYVKE